MARRSPVARCADCYRPVDGAHRALGRCPGTPEPKQERRRQAPAGYVAPSRAGRPSRDEYLAEVTTTPEHKRRLHAERQRRYRQRRAER